MIQIGSQQPAIENSSTLIALSVTLFIASILILIGRRFDKFKPIIIKTAALITMTTLIISLVTTTPIQALPEEKLYFWSDANPPNIGTLYPKPDGRALEMKKNQDYWWRSSNHYEIYDWDDGLWHIHLEGKC